MLLQMQFAFIKICFAYRKAFKCNLWESVKELQLFCERMDLKHIFAFRKLSFCWKVPRLDNRLMKAVIHCTVGPLSSLI